MSAWIPITILAAFVQNLRFMLQKHLKASGLSSAGATFARFVYSAPLAAAVALIYAASSGQALPRPGPDFWAFALAGGLTQILATVAVVALFGPRNFSVGMTLKNTEIIQVGLVGFLVLGERVSATGLVAIAVGFAGLVLLSKPPGSGESIFNRGAALGVLAGALFAVSAVGYRGASLALPSGDVFLRASATLAVVTLSQTAMMVAWLIRREPGQIGRVLRAWRVAGLVGVSSMLGSLCWFTAFTLTNAAYVRALGQVELVFSYAGSVLWFREVPGRRETAGIVLLLVSIVLLIVGL